MSFPKYNVGDKVVISQSIVGGYNCPKTDCYINRDMTEYKGRVATIKAIDVYKSDTPSRRYYLDIDDREWQWTYTMFQPLKLLKRKELS
jgi:hypothetical protein